MPKATMRKRERRNGFNNLLTLMAACVLFYAVFAYQIRNASLFRPAAATYTAADNGILWIDADDGARLAAQWRPARGSKWTVLYFHGNGEDLGAAQPTISNYQLQGVSVLSFDYRGFGLTEGKATEANAVSDAETILDHAISALGADPERIVLHGRDVGAGIALQLAAKRRPAGVIVESAYLSLLRLYLPIRWAPGDRFKNEAAAKRLRCPALVIHGKRDLDVPFEHGERLAEAISPELVKTAWIEEGGHADLASGAASPYWPAIRGFLSSLGPPKVTATP